MSKSSSQYVANGENLDVFSATAGMTISAVTPAMRAAVAVGGLLSVAWSKKTSVATAAAAAMPASSALYFAAHAPQSRPGGSSFLIVVEVAAVVNGFPVPNLKVFSLMLAGTEGVAPDSIEETWG